MQFFFSVLPVKWKENITDGIIGDRH